MQFTINSSLFWWHLQSCCKMTKVESNKNKNLITYYFFPWPFSLMIKSFQVSWLFLMVKIFSNHTKIEEFNEFISSLKKNSLGRKLMIFCIKEQNIFFLWISCGTSWSKTIMRVRNLLLSNKSCNNIGYPAPKKDLVLKQCFACACIYLYNKMKFPFILAVMNFKLTMFFFVPLEIITLNGNINWDFQSNISKMLFAFIKCYKIEKAKLKKQISL